MLRPRFIGARPAEVAELRRAALTIERRRGDSRPLLEVWPSRRGRGKTVLFDGITLAESGTVLEAMTRINAREVESGAVPPLTRPMLESRRVRYIRTDPEEWWMFLRQIWRNKGGDCEDLAAGVAGSMRAAGRAARAVILPPKAGVSHVVVELPTGAIADPSIWGGMGTAQEAQAAALEVPGRLGTGSYEHVLGQLIAAGFLR